MYLFNALQIPAGYDIKTDTCVPHRSPVSTIKTVINCLKINNSRFVFYSSGGGFFFLTLTFPIPISCQLQSISMLKGPTLAWFSEILLSEITLTVTWVASFRE